MNDSNAQAKAIFGRNLKRARTHSGLTMKQCAEKLGYGTYETYAKYERGERMPSVVIAKRMAEIFGVTLDELAEGI